MNLRKAYHSLAESYWFLPGLMTLASVVVGLLAGFLDAWVNVDALFRLLRLDRVSAEGARTMLSTAAGSMITVAGVTFSITIVAIATVTSQFGSRVFSNFMDDRGSQVTLGIFLGTFVYCLVVLAWVRSSAEGHGAFVPQLALIGAMLLVLLSVGAFIYFIHHTADNLRIQTQIDAIGRRLRRALVQRFEESGEALPRPPPEPRWDRNCEIVADRPGYVRRIDYAVLVQLAQESDTTLRLLVSPGDFVVGGQALVRGAGREVEAAEARAAFEIGPSRSGSQDFTYYIDQLVEIAVRALSPGINDPFTAGNCVDWLGDGLLTLSGRRLPGGVLHDSAGTPRLFRNALEFDAVVGGAMGQLLPYFAGDRNAALQLMEALARCYRSGAGQRRQVFADYALRLRDAAKTRLDEDAIALLDRRIEGLERPDADGEEEEETPRAG